MDPDGRPVGGLWQCDGNALSMLMSVGTYAGSRGDLRVTLQTEGSPILYPAQVTETDTLNDLELSVRGDRDVLGLVGSRTQLTFARRVVTTLDAASGVYRVTSDVVARVYVLRVPVKVARLRSQEWVHADLGLIRHRLTATDGRVWQLERRDVPLAPDARAE